MVVPKLTKKDSLVEDDPRFRKETCEAEAGKSSQKRKRARLLSPIEMLNGLLKDDQESEKRASSAILESTTGLDEQSPSVLYQRLHPRTILMYSRGSRRIALDHGDEPRDALIVNNRELTAYQQEWPFIKQSPVWANIESLELYQNPPQKPHFSPLKEVREDLREGLAIAQFVTFANVAQRSSELKLDDPNDMIEDSLEILVELETHGFYVGPVRARLNGLLSKKARVGELKDKLIQVKTDLEKRNLEKAKIDEELGQLNGKMQDLKEKLRASVKKKNMKDVEIMILQSNMHMFANHIMDWKVNFEKLAASPL